MLHLSPPPNPPLSTPHRTVEQIFFAHHCKSPPPQRRHRHPSSAQSPSMAQSKSAKRKRNAQAQQHPNKSTKTAANALPSPPSNGTTTPTFEPKSLQTVISDEELEITVETLQTLAQYPNLTKSKLCKDLRAAVYDFRQSCTTGLAAAGMSLLKYILSDA